MANSQVIVTVYRGRFAPSPTGPLHFGSLVAAVGSYLEAKFNGGEWLVRIEDLDPPRVVSGASSEILTMLDRLGMEWDGEVIYQSRRKEIYQDALASLDQLGLIYPCFCSRKEIVDSSVVGISGSIYPGTCRNNAPNRNKPGALRVKTNHNSIEFIDILNGSVCQRLRNDIGDFIIRRADGVYAYQLAVVVDDAAQNITHVVRGADLLDSTPRQIYLQQLLGFITPVYMHLPLVINNSGEKLSKQTKAVPIDLSNAQSQLVAALQFLGQAPPTELMTSTIPSFWQWAIENWRSDKIPYPL